MQPSTAEAIAGQVLAIDLGGTKVAVAVVDEAGCVLARCKAPVEKAGAAATAEQVGALAAELLAGRRVAGTGVAVPGIYCPATGLAWAPNLWGRDQVPVAAFLEARLPSRLLK